MMRSLCAQARWAALAAAIGAASISAALAADAPGVTATEIKLGQTMTYTGIGAQIGEPFGRSQQAYFRMINDQGGVNGRKIVLESLDDEFDPQKALELTKKLVEQDHVAAMFGTLGTPQNMAIRDYLNHNQVPQLFITTGDDQVVDYKRYPWTIGGVPTFRVEAQIFGRYILVNLRGSKIGFLHSRDQLGQSYVVGMRQGLGEEFSKFVVKEEEMPDDATTIAPQIAALRDAGADVLVIAGPPAMVGRAVAATAGADWHPTRFIDFAASGAVIGMAGVEAAKGAITANSYLDPTDPRWTEDGSIKPFTEFVDKYLPGAQSQIGYFLAAYVSAQAMVQVLKQCGDDLSRDNIMLQAANLKDFHPLGLLPGISFNTSRTKYLPIVEAALQRFDGKHWRQFGDVIAGF
jgi:branched-chain amino acid transport system substrate-binding protein